MADNLYHAENGLPMIDGAGQYRVLACLPPKAICGLARFSDAHPLLPRSQWRPFSGKGFTCPIFDQGMTSSCVGQSSVKAFMRSMRPYPVAMWAHERRGCRS